jgi:hypothetical protein
MLEQYCFQGCRQRCVGVSQHRRQPQDNTEIIDRPSTQKWEFISSISRFKKSFGRGLLDQSGQRHVFESHGKIPHGEMALRQHGFPGLRWLTRAGLNGQKAT